MQPHRTGDASESIAIVGSGPVAQALGRLMYESGQPVIGLVARDAVRAQRAATFIGASVQVMRYTQVPRLASRVLVAVSDNAIANVAGALVEAGMQTGTVLHTCGGVGPDALGALRHTAVSCGVLHPMQTMTSPEQGVESLEGITVGIAGDEAAVTWAREIAQVSLGGEVIRIPEGGMAAYHAGAVLAGNSLVALLDAAATLLAQAGISRDDAMRAIGPLSRASLENTLRRGPAAALTGPVSRGDAGTVARHVRAVYQHAPEVMPVYLAVSRRLLDIARQQGLSTAGVQAIESILDAEESGERREDFDRANT